LKRRGVLKKNQEEEGGKYELCSRREQYGE
jgi:hypothetical protein